MALPPGSHKARRTLSESAPARLLQPLSRASLQIATKRYQAAKTQLRRRCREAPRVGCWPRAVSPWPDSDERVVAILRQADLDAIVAVAKRHGVSEPVSRERRSLLLGQR
jgi:hypothetical protein